jgi:hypothetical protein
MDFTGTKTLIANKMQTYTDAEKVKNYYRIKKHIHLINTHRLTEDLMEEYKNHIFILRNNYWDFSIVDSDIEDYDFRSAAVEAETLISSLIGDIKMYKTFKVGDYLQFLYCLVKMSNYIEEEDDDVSRLFESMKFQ